MKTKKTDNGKIRRTKGMDCRTHSRNHTLGKEIENHG